MIYLRLTIIVLLLVVPSFVHSFFLINPITIPLPRAIICYTNNEQMGSDDYQLCAIRVYTNLDSSVNSTVYNGIWFANTFRQLIKLCSGFSNMTDVGIGNCSALAYETFTTMTLCICVDSYCNVDLDTCRRSAIATSASQKLPDVLPDLSNNRVICKQTNNASATFTTCTEHLFINYTECTNYIASNSVLCSVSMINAQTTGEAFILENYEQTLMNNVHVLRISSFGSTLAPIETNTAVYYTYKIDDTNAYQKCICTTPNLCNTDMNTCVSQTVVNNNITASTITNVFTSASAIANDSTTNLAMTSMAASSIILNTLTDSSPINSIASITTNAPTSLSPAKTSTAASITTVQQATPPAAGVTPSTNTDQSPPGDSGLGSAAAAGIACGIVFSALVFIGEIVVLKFFYSTSAASGASAGGRAVNYRA